MKVLIALMLLQFSCKTVRNSSSKLENFNSTQGEFYSPAEIERKLQQRVFKNDFSFCEQFLGDECSTGLASIMGAQLGRVRQGAKPGIINSFLWFKAMDELTDKLILDPLYLGQFGDPEFASAIDLLRKGGGDSSVQVAKVWDLIMEMDAPSVEKEIWSSEFVMELAASNQVLRSQIVKQRLLIALTHPYFLLQ